MRESGSPPTGVTLVAADRSEPGAYDAVSDRDWDFVVDVSRQPAHVRSALAALAGRAGHWLFVSTLSVYADDTEPGQDEDAALHEPWRGEGLAGIDDYGPAKVSSTRGARVVPGRPGGQGRTDRRVRRPQRPLRLLAARVARAGRGAEVLVPPLDDPCQVVDVEDLAAWLVRCGEARVGGVVNAMGPPTSLADVLAACAEAAGSTDWAQASRVAPRACRRAVDGPEVAAPVAAAARLRGVHDAQPAARRAARAGDPVPDGDGPRRPAVGAGGSGRTGAGTRGCPEDEAGLTALRG